MKVTLEFDTAKIFDAETCEAIDAFFLGRLNALQTAKTLRWFRAQWEQYMSGLISAVVRDKTGELGRVTCGDDRNKNLLAGELEAAVEIARRWRYPVLFRDALSVEIGAYLVDWDDGTWRLSEIGGDGSGMPRELEQFRDAGAAVFFAIAQVLWELLNAREQNAENADERRDQNEKISALSASSALNSVVSRAPHRSTLTLRPLDHKTLIVDAVPAGRDDAPPEFRDVARVIGWASINPGLQIAAPLGCDAVGRILEMVREYRDYYGAIPEPQKGGA